MQDYNPSPNSIALLGSNTLQRLLYVYVFLGMIWMNIGGLMSKGCPK
jgi:hypothetical protein